MNHDRYEYGASIYRKMGPGNTILGYYYSVIEEGPEPPSMQAEISGRKTRTVSIPEGGNIHDLVGTIHSHPFDPGTRRDRDHQRQVALVNGNPFQDSPSGAFSYTRDPKFPGDIDSSILQQLHADQFNPLPSDRPQEHYLMTAGNQLWMYTPERPVIYDLNIQPERALNKKLFHYVGQIKN